MKEVEFRVPKQCDFEGAEQLIERVCAESGLILGMKGSLAGYPGSVHWHYKKEKQKGTLELTLYRKQSRIWAQVQNGRRDDLDRCRAAAAAASHRTRLLQLQIR